jgi:hypothetical protein
MRRATDPVDAAVGLVDHLAGGGLVRLANSTPLRR